MELFPPISELYPFIVALLIAGTMAGILAGLFGIGGGAILVPVFYQILGVLEVDEAIRMHLSVGTSLAIIVPTSLRSFAGHRAKGVVDMGVLKSFLVVVPAGVVMASIVTAFISGSALRIIFTVFSLAVAMKLLFAKDDWRIGDELPTDWARSFAGWIIGFFSTFMGIGGGVFNNTFMTLYGRPIHQAVATSSGVGVLISIPGVLGYVWAGWSAGGLPPFSVGYVNLLMVAIVTPVTLLVAPIGVKAAHRLSKRYLEFGFGIFLLIVAARFGASLI